MGRANANSVSLQTIIIVVNIANIIVIVEIMCTSSDRCRISSSFPQPFRLQPAVMQDPGAKHYPSSVWAFPLPSLDTKRFHNYEADRW